MQYSHMTHTSSHFITMVDLLWNTIGRLIDHSDSGRHVLFILFVAIHSFVYICVFVACAQVDLMMANRPKRVIPCT